MANMIQMQIGKKGLTAEFIERLKITFKNAESIRISVLKSATREKEEVKKWSDEILSKLGKNYTIKIIGYTIVVRKWRKARA